MALSPIREAALRVACSFVAVNARDDKDRYLQIVAPHEPADVRAFLATAGDPRTSGCGLVVTALYRGLGLKHPKWDNPLVPGFAIERNLQVAREVGAWVDYTADRWPLPGDAPYLYRAAVTDKHGNRIDGSSQHTYIVRDVDPSTGSIYGIDGGQVDSRGYQEIQVRRHYWSDGKDMPSNRPILGWIDLERLCRGLLSGTPVLAPSPAVPAPEPPLEGIDVASVNGVVDWRAVRSAGVTWAYARGMIGRDDVDRRARANVTEARAAGLVTGLYGVCYPRAGKPQDAALQAQQLHDLIVATGANAEPMVDWEVRNGATAAETAVAGRLCCETLRSLGYRPLLYTYPSFVAALRAERADLSWCTDYRLWIAHYAEERSGPSPVPMIPLPWTQHLIWQYAASEGVIGRVPGVATMVDRNRLYGTLDDIRHPDPQ